MHERFMRRCLELATVARQQGNTSVGSVVVLDGEIIGEGIEALPVGTSITGHAETLACQAALDATGRRDLAGAGRMFAMRLLDRRRVASPGRPRSTTPKCAGIIRDRECPLVSCFRV